MHEIFNTELFFHRLHIARFKCECQFDGRKFHGQIASHAVSADGCTAETAGDLFLCVCIFFIDVCPLLENGILHHGNIAFFNGNGDQTIDRIDAVTHFLGISSLECRFMSFDELVKFFCAVFPVADQIFGPGQGLEPCTGGSFALCGGDSACDRVVEEVQLVNMEFFLVCGIQHFPVKLVGLVIFQGAFVNVCQIDFGFVHFIPGQVGQFDRLFQFGVGFFHLHEFQQAVRNALACIDLLHVGQTGELCRFLIQSQRFDDAVFRIDDTAAGEVAPEGTVSTVVDDGEFDIVRDFGNRHRLVVFSFNCSHVRLLLRLHGSAQMIVGSCFLRRSDVGLFHQFIECSLGTGKIFAVGGIVEFLHNCGSLGLDFGSLCRSRLFLRVKFCRKTGKERTREEKHNGMFHNFTQPFFWAFAILRSLRIYMIISLRRESRSSSRGLMIARKRSALRASVLYSTSLLARAFWISCWRSVQ